MDDRHPVTDGAQNPAYRPAHPLTCDFTVKRPFWRQFVKGPDFTVLSDLLVGGKHRDASDGARFERAEEFARLISIENGKAIADVRAEVAYAAEFLRWYAEEAVRVPGGLQAAPSGGEFDSERTVIAAAGLVVCRRVAPAR